MIHESECAAMVVREQACGGHSSTFPVVCHSLPSISTVSKLPFPFSLWSVTLSLFTPPLSLSRTNVLSHHCFFSLLSLSHTDTLSQVLPPLASIFHFWWTPIISPSLPLSSLSLMLISVVGLPLFCSGFLNNTEPCSPVTST